MITQKTIKEWLPGAIDLFKSVMPPASKPYPEFPIASNRTIERVRNDWIEKTQSWNVNQDPFSSIMETLHGDGGDAVIINQSNCRNDLYEFKHQVWHELGHFYAVSNEKKKYNLFAGQRTFPNDIRQNGYLLWKEFIAESISNFVTGQLSQPDYQYINNPNYWRRPYGNLHYMLQQAYDTYQFYFDEYSLGFYFATLLTDNETRAFLDASENNALLEWDPDKWDYVPMNIYDFDPYAFDLLPKQYTGLLLDIRDLLKEKVSEQEFWTVDGVFLDELGSFVTELHNLKGSSMISDAFRKNYGK